MKKLALAALIISATTFSAPKIIDNIIVNGGITTNNKFGANIEDVFTGVIDGKSSYVFGLEAFKEVVKLENGKIELGLGIKYEAASTLKNELFEGEILTSIPIYVSGKITLKAQKDVNMYFQGNVGYPKIIEEKWLDTDEKAGIEGTLYTGVGIGVEKKNLNIGINYNISKAKLKAFDEDVSKGFYSNIALNLGYKFDIK